MRVEENKSEYWQNVWLLFKQGDKESFAKLYNRHIQSLYRYGNKLSPDQDTVNDAIQEVFIDLYLRHKTISTCPEKLKSYLIMALRHNLIHRLKKDRKTPVKEIGEQYYFDPQYSIETQLINSEMEAEINQKVQQALEQLPSKQKEAIYLRYNESLEYSEVARILDVTVESVRKQVYRALKTLKEIIDNKGIIMMSLFFQKKN